MALTQKQALAAIRKTGAKVSRTSYGEFKVNIPGGTEATAYYTDDPRDAVGTAQEMMRYHKRGYTQVSRHGGLFGSGLRGK